MVGDRPERRSSNGAGALPGYAETWLEQPEMLLAEIERDAEDVERWFAGTATDARDGRQPLIDQATLVVAVLDPARQLVEFSQGISVDRLDAMIDWDAAARALVSSSPLLVATALDSTPRGGQAIFAYAAGRLASEWQLPNLPPDHVDAARGGLVVVATTFVPAKAPLTRACRAYDLTGLQTRVVAATVRTGSIRRAAEELGIAYATAREAISASLAKTGCTRLPALIHQLSLLAFGIFPDDVRGESILTDTYGLTPRQADIAVLLAQGLSREETARALGLSVATVKKQADIVFSTLHVGSAAALATALSSLLAMNELVGASQGGIAWFNSEAEPLRFVLRSNGSRIALSDHGPRSGRPVVILHSSMCSRHAPRGLVAALQQRGWRPISIDRPGFGLTDIEGAPRLVEADDPFEPAAHDMATVLDALGIARTDIIARGGAQVALAFAALYPDRVDRVVLVNPDPPSHEEHRRVGPLGAFKEAYLRRPAIISPAARLLARLLDRNTVARILARSLAGSPADEAIAAQPDFIDDYFRALRMFSVGRLDGYAREQLFFASGRRVGWQPDTRGWQVLIGETDTLSDPAQVLSHWRERLTGAQFRMVEGAGRLLAYGMPEMVVDHLMIDAER